jgi:hypothetical protein
MQSFEGEYNWKEYKKDIDYAAGYLLKTPRNCSYRRQVKSPKLRATISMKVNSGPWLHVQPSSPLQSRYPSSSTPFSPGLLGLDAKSPPGIGPEGQTQGKMPDTMRSQTASRTPWVFYDQICCEHNRPGRQITLREHQRQLHPITILAVLSTRHLR